MSVSEIRRIVVIAEGETEKAIQGHLSSWLHQRARRTIELRVMSVRHNLNEHEVRKLAGLYAGRAGTAVVVLSDVHGTVFKGKPPEQIKSILQGWLPQDAVAEGRARAHLALHEFEAWLLVGWEHLCRDLKIPNKRCPGANPEAVNHDHPPSHHIKALYHKHSKPPRTYNKRIEGKKLFERLDLEEVARQCPEFKAFLHTLLHFSGGEAETTGHS